jgi:C4-dicarboxylate-specific signal transduction histidine kinase
MAEVATGVLHNVGNILNSINVSCTLLLDQLRESRVGNFSRVMGLISENRDNLSFFMAHDPRGQKILPYLDSLSSALGEEHQMMQKETESLQERIEHIKEIVTMQQSYGRVSGISETIPVEQLMEDALKLNIGSLARHKVTIMRHYESAPPVTVDKHAVLQILLNLINNAKYACIAGKREERVVTLKILRPHRGRIRMQVEDNGVGISRENLTKIFRHGFTTKKTGHGFGLHSGALTARKLGGSLEAHSEGPGRGAVFTLELLCPTGDHR